MNTTQVAALGRAEFKSVRRCPVKGVIGFADIYQHENTYLLEYLMSQQSGNWLVPPNVLEQASPDIKVLLVESRDESFQDAQTKGRVLTTTACKKILRSAPVYPGTAGRPPYVRIYQHENGTLFTQ